jgi:hypothetical protein
VGAKEAKRQQERDAHLGATQTDEAEDKKGEKDDEDVMGAYWRELKAANEKRAAEKQAAENKAEDDDDGRLRLLQFLLFPLLCRPPDLP